MNLDRATLVRFREQARQARRAGHYAQAADRELQAVELAGTLGLTGERTRALLWEGYSLRLAGEDDLALAALLQVIHEPATNPADRFSALIALLHLSLERKPARFCRALLEQSRQDVLDFRQPWSALLDFLDGELAYRQGDFAAAGAWHERAWAGRRDTHPQLTPATYLWAQCRTAFRRRVPELEQCAQQLIRVCPNSILEQQLAIRAQWLCWRARHVDIAHLPASPAHAIAVEQARALLMAAENAAGPVAARLEALRVTALVSDWDVIANHLRQKPLFPDTFETALVLGDLALSRARAALGLAAMDDDYDYNGAALDAPAALITPDSRPVTALLNEARQHYQAAARWAADQDQRLETGWYGVVVRHRQARLTRLAPGRQD